MSDARIEALWRDQERDGDELLGLLARSGWQPSSTRELAGRPLRNLGQVAELAFVLVGGYSGGVSEWHEEHRLRDWQPDQVTGWVTTTGGGFRLAPGQVLDVQPRARVSCATAPGAELPPLWATVYATADGFVSNVDELGSVAIGHVVARDPYEGRLVVELAPGRLTLPGGDS